MLCLFGHRKALFCDTEENLIDKFEPTVQFLKKKVFTAFPNSGCKRKFCRKFFHIHPSFRLTIKHFQNNSSINFNEIFVFVHLQGSVDTSIETTCITLKHLHERSCRQSFVI